MGAIQFLKTFARTHSVLPNTKSIRMATSPLSAWGLEPDMENRDPNNMNDGLKVSWEELIGEPDHTRSLDCCWKCSFKCFNLWKSLFYCLATTFCSCCIMMYWGCLFAGIAFHQIWIITPMLRLYEITIGNCAKIYGMIIHACIDPLAE